MSAPHEEPPGVLVLHNRPRDLGGEHAESDAGVLNEVAAVREALHALGYPSRVADVRRLSDVPGAVASGTEQVVFNLVEALEGDLADVNAVPAVCRALGRACTGNDFAALQVTADKALTKAALVAAGLPTPTYHVVAPGAAIPDVAFPVIVKPVCTDASEGIEADTALPADRAALERAIRRIHERFGQPALVEHYIEGREFNVSVLELGGRPTVLPLAEIDFSELPPESPRIVDYAAKWREDAYAFHHTPRRLPAEVDEALAARLRQVAIDCRHAVGCRGYVRVDLRVDSDGAPWVLEINANPDISPDAGFAAALTAAGMCYADFVRETVAGALGQQLPTTGPVDPQASPPPHDEAPIVRATLPADRDTILALATETGFFRPDELTIAAEVLDDALAGREGYRSYTLLDGNVVRGWVCFGETPCTLGTYDIYWLAVHPAFQGRGGGQRLMAEAEARIRAAGGRLAIIETAGRVQYAPTRRFYERLGYETVARIPDFYAPGDDLVIGAKRL